MRKKKTWEPLPLTLKCPIGGEEWPATSIKSTLDTASERLTDGCITFQCPSNHFFTLSRALRAGIFTRAQANRLLEVAKKDIDKYHELPLWQVLPFLEKKLKEGKKDAGW